MMLFNILFLRNFPCNQLWRASKLSLYSLVCSWNKKKKIKKERKKTVIKHFVLQILHNILNSYFHCTARSVETQACPLTLHEELCSLVTAVSRSWGVVMFILRIIFGRARSWSLGSNITLSQKETEFCLDGRTGCVKVEWMWQKNDEFVAWTTSR